MEPVPCISKFCEFTKISQQDLLLASTQRSIIGSGLRMSFPCKPNNEEGKARESFSKVVSILQRGRVQSIPKSASKQDGPFSSSHLSSLVRRHIYSRTHQQWGGLTVTACPRGARPPRPNRMVRPRPVAPALNPPSSTPQSSTRSRRRWPRGS